MLQGNGTHDIKSQAITGIISTVGKTAVKNMRKILRRDTDAGIRHLDDIRGMLSLG